MKIIISNKRNLYDELEIIVFAELFVSTDGMPTTLGNTPALIQLAHSAHISTHLSTHLFTHLRLDSFSICLSSSQRLYTEHLVVQRCLFVGYSKTIFEGFQFFATYRSFFFSGGGSTSNL